MLVSVLGAAYETFEFSAVDYHKIMAALPVKSAKVGVEEATETIHRIRITISSKNVKNLEKLCADLI
ncbi:hypothetical protein R1flu_004426 [Riccia fluitans]|uniref:Uncharacterized protein n=1 Tax=Riccia fluitans TaxID=41844 RepID=A0ABD1YU96_9MARC